MEKIELMAHLVSMEHLYMSSYPIWKSNLLQQQGRWTYGLTKLGIPWDKENLQLER